MNLGLLVTFILVVCENIGPAADDARLMKIASLVKKLGFVVRARLEERKKSGKLPELCCLLFDILSCWDFLVAESVECVPRFIYFVGRVLKA